MALQEVHDNEVSALCFNSQGNYVATGGADKVVKVWSWRESQGERVRDCVSECVVECVSTCAEKLEPKCSLTGSSASIMSVQFDHHVSP